MQTNHEKKYDERAMSLVLEACLEIYEEVAEFTVRNKSFINFLQGRLFEITAEDAKVPEEIFIAIVADLKSLRDDQVEYEAFYRSIDVESSEPFITGASSIQRLLIHIGELKSDYDQKNLNDAGTVPPFEYDRTESG